MEEGRGAERERERDARVFGGENAVPERGDEEIGLSREIANGDGRIRFRPGKQTRIVKSRFTDQRVLQQTKGEMVLDRVKRRDSLRSSSDIRREESGCDR